MLSIIEQRVQRVRYLVYGKKINVFLARDPHSETDLGEGCVPVGRQFGLLCIKNSLCSAWIIGLLFAPNA